MRALARPDALPHLDVPVRRAGPHLEPGLALALALAGEHVAGDALVAEGVAAGQPPEELARDAHVVDEDTRRLALAEEQVPAARAPDGLGHAAAAAGPAVSVGGAGDAPGGDAGARVRGGEVVQADPAGPGGGGDEAGVAGVGGLGGEGGDGAAHADAAALGRVAVRRDGLDAPEGPAAGAGDVELGQQVAGARDEVRAGGRPGERRRRQEGLGPGFRQRVAGRRLLVVLVLLLRGRGRGGGGGGGEVEELDGVVPGRDQKLLRPRLGEPEVRRARQDVARLRQLDGGLGHELEGPAGRRREEVLGHYVAGYQI